MITDQHQQDKMNLYLSQREEALKQIQTIKSQPVICAADEVSLAYWKTKYQSANSMYSRWSKVENSKLRHNEYCKSYRIKNLDHIRSTEQTTHQKLRDGMSPLDWKIRGMIIGARSRAKKHNLPFNITKEDVVIPERCPVFGTKFNLSNTEMSDDSPSLDKIIPSKGYVKGNICVISSRANTLKRDGNLNEFIQIVKYLEQFNGN